MITMRIFKRERKKLGDLRSGDTFKLVGTDKVYQVIDLTKTDGFLAPGPALREDVSYCICLLDGEVCIHQKMIEIELVNLEFTEIIDVAST